MIGDGNHTIHLIQFIQDDLGRLKFLANVRHNRDGKLPGRSQDLRNPPHVIDVDDVGAGRGNE